VKTAAACLGELTTERGKETKQGSLFETSLSLLKAKNIVARKRE